MSILPLSPDAVTPADFAEIRWKGHWIWVPEEKIEIRMSLPGGPQEQRPEAHGFFRRTLTLAALPARVPARITADSRYILYVNGREVFRGPVRSQPRRLAYDLFDLAPYLQRGENVIAVHVKYYGRPYSFYIPPNPNSGLGRSGVMVFEADLGPAGWLVSDESWKARKINAWEAAPDEQVDPIGGGVPVEILDARLLPGGWTSAAFDDSQWGGAQLLRAIHIGGFAHSQPPTDPYGPLQARDIAKLGGELAAPQSWTVDALAARPDVSAYRPAARLVAAMRQPAAAGAPSAAPSGAPSGAPSAASSAALPARLEIPAGGALRLIADFGRIVSGLVQLEVDAPAGAIFELCYVEEPITGHEMGFAAPHNGSRYIARGQDDRFEAFESNGLRYIYLLVHAAAGPIQITHLAVRELIYPWRPGAAFECSDPELNRLYTAGIRTVALNSHDSFLDCPTREQRAWVGDSVVHQMVHLATNTDWRLAFHYLDLGASPRPDGILPMSVGGEIEASGDHTIPDWSLHWVHGVYNLYRFVGDRERVKAYLPVIERILRWYVPYFTSQGVIKDIVEWNLVDWASLYVEDTSSIITAVWARGLREFAEMAGWLEENASRRWAEGLYARAKAGYEVFWDEGRGLYIDHIKDGVKQRPASQVAGALAIVSGLAPEDRWQRILTAITDPARLVVRSWTGGDSGEYSQSKMQKQFMGIYEADWDVEEQIVIGEPFISYLVHDAVVAAGQAHRLPELHRRWGQFLTGGYDTIGECWGWGTHVHGWSCAPTRDLVFYILGVTPAEPGYAAARIAPRLGRLAWAKGKVPTPAGLISVEVTGEKIAIDSPIPFILDLEGKPPVRLAAGSYSL